MNILVNIKAWLNTRGVVAAAILLSGGPAFATASVDPHQLARNMILSPSTQTGSEVRGETAGIPTPAPTDPHALARKVMHSDEDLSVNRWPHQDYGEGDMAPVPDLQYRLRSMISGRSD